MTTVYPYPLFFNKKGVRTARARRFILFRADAFRTALLGVIKNKRLLFPLALLFLTATQGVTRKQ